MHGRRRVPLFLTRQKRNTRKRLRLQKEMSKKRGLERGVLSTQYEQLLTRLAICRKTRDRQLTGAGSDLITGQSEP